MIARWFHRVEALGSTAKGALLLLLFAAIVVADLVTGLDLTLRALYLVPVGAAAWLLGKRAGIFLSLVSVGISSYFDVAFGLERTHASFVYSDAAVRLGVFLAAAATLAELRIAQSRLGGLAQSDPLTDLYNRRGFRRIADREIERARRAHTSLTVMHIDLDGFKAVNDSLGHAAGDEVLVAVGRALKSSRVTDVASRLGGDEFALLLPDTASESAATAVGRIVARLNEAMASHAWPITFSVGVVTYHQPPSSLDEMLAVADALMYEVKRNGKAGVRHRDIGRARSAEEAPRIEA